MSLSGLLSSHPQRSSPLGSMIFPFLQVISGGEMDVVLTGPAISMVDLAAICFWLKAEANLLPAAGSQHYYENNYPKVPIMKHLRQTKIGETHYFSRTRTV